MFIGISNGFSSYGKKLKQGGTCIIQDDSIQIAISEERITKEKHAGGFENSLNSCLSSLNQTTKQAIGIVTSSCCDFKPITNHSNIFNSSKSVDYVSHHLSHAMGAYFCSDFDKAIVVVMDGGGNTLEEKSENWWENKREQLSIFLAEGNKIKLVNRYFSEPYEVGYGEAFRYATKFLGFGNTENAGKVMALSALQKKSNNLPIPNIFSLPQIIKNTPLEPIDTIKNLIDKYNLQIAPLKQGHPFAEEHIAFSHYIQSSFQSHLASLINQNIEKLNVKNVCLSGGVALNCSANTFLLNNTNIHRLFVQPASNDSGQCIGNAIYSFLTHTKKDIRFTLNNCYLGKKYTNIDVSVSKILTRHSESLALVSRDDGASLLKAAEMLINGEVVGLFQGRAEFGPRALGNRSILANPTSKRIKKFLNVKIKNREAFMPFAASVLEDRIFDIFEDLVSDTMVLAPKLKQKWLKKIPGAAHADGSCRAQSVKPNNNPRLYQLIQNVYRINNIPMLLNTSMNIRGEPIVETVEDAISWFLRSEVNYLLVENMLIEKKQKSTSQLI
jgi:carbamoyltransferase